MWFTIIQMIVMMALVFAACYWCSKRFARVTLRTRSSKYMELLDQMVLGQDKYLSIIKIGNKFLIISVTQQEIKILAEIEESQLKAIHPDENPTGTDFSSLIKKLRSKEGRDQ